MYACSSIVEPSGFRVLTVGVLLVLSEVNSHTKPTAQVVSVVSVCEYQGAGASAGARALALVDIDSALGRDLCLH